MAESILVVDDDPDIARFVEVNLRSAGYEVAVAGDGEEALEKAGELRPDLVLLDVMMPRIDGFEVAQRLRKNPQTANTSIIMLTAKALSADKVTGLQSGGDDFVAVVGPDVAEDVAKRICERFDESRSEFYDAEDLERGYVRMEDRKGVLQDIPLVAISVGIATTSRRAFAHYGEAVAVATEMKQFAKRDQGSSYAIDRRAP